MKASKSALVTGGRVFSTDSLSESPGISFRFLLEAEDFPEDVTVAFEADFGPEAEEGLAADVLPVGARFARVPDAMGTEEP